MFLLMPSLNAQHGSKLSSAGGDVDCRALARMPAATPAGVGSEFAATRRMRPRARRDRASPTPTRPISSQRPLPGGRHR
jgi:hypothetical protein